MQARTLRTVKLGVGSVAAGAAVISVEHVYHFAVRIGESQLSAVLLAVVLEGAIAAAAAVILGWDRAENGTSPFVAWILLALGLGGSMAGNVAAAITPEGQVAAAWPPLLTFVGTMVLAGLDRAGATPARAVRPRKPKAETIPAPAPSSRVVPGPARPEPKPKTKPSQEPKTEPPLDDLEVARARKVVEDYAAANDGRKIPRDEFKAELRVGSAKARRLLDAIEKEVAA